MHHLPTVSIPSSRHFSDSGRFLTSAPLLYRASFSSSPGFIQFDATEFDLDWFSELRSASEPLGAQITCLQESGSMTVSTGFFLVVAAVLLLVVAEALL
jgi:hypothetical protein